MWPILTSDQEMLRDMTVRYLNDRVPLGRLRKDRGSVAGFDVDYWKGGTELGWTSLLVGEAEGGGSASGRGAVDLALIAYEFGRHAAPGPLVDCNVVAAALAGHPGDLPRAALAELLSGAATAACCLGAAPWQRPGQAGITIRREGDGFVASGTARPVESAAQAAHLLVTGRGDEGMVQLLLPARAPGVEIAPLTSMDVTRRFAAVTFHDVRAPAEALVGIAGEAEASVARQIRYAAVMLAAEAVGAMDMAFDMTLDWAFHRYSFGRALASYQALKHRFADMKSWLEASRAAAGAAADAVADGSALAADAASAARAYIGQYGPELVQQCVQLHGGIGITYEHDLHFFLRRVTLDSLLFGTPAEHRRLLAMAQIEREQAA